MNNTISIIIANYNNAEYLGHCFDSILNQTYKNIEVVFIDDVSSDNSIAIAESYKEHFRQFQLIKNDKNIGVARTRNKGFESANGYFLTTLDSDDYFYSDKKLEKEINLYFDKLENSKKEIIAFSDIIMISDMGEKPVSKMLPVKEGKILKHLISRTCLIPRDFLFTKSMLEFAGFYKDYPLYEDWDLKIRLSKKYEYFYTGIPGIGYRRHGSGLSSAPAKDHIYWLKRIFRENIIGLKLFDWAYAIINFRKHILKMQSARRLKK